MSEDPPAASPLLDPELAAFVAETAAPAPAGKPSATMARLLGAPRPSAEGVVCSETTAPAEGTDPPVRVLVYRPAQAEGLRPAVLHIHAGGYVGGAPEMSAADNLELAKRFGVVVVSVDYRLAPGAKYPGPLADCHAVLRWMRSGLSGLLIDPKRVGLWGDSAGGGLAAALAILARDSGEAPLGFLHLIAPMIDDRTVVRDASPHIGQHVWTAAQNAYGWSSYLPMAPGAADVPACAAAARAGNLAGLPPTFIACGALDLFVDENVELARKLVAVGVPTELRVYAGAPHGFWLVRDAAVAKRFQRDAFEALARHLS